MEGRPVSVTGRLDGPFDDPTFDLTVRGDVDIERLGRRFGVAWPLQGIVQATARVQGRARVLRVAANVASKEVRVASVTAQAVTARLADYYSEYLGFVQRRGWPRRKMGPDSTNPEAVRWKRPGARP